MVQHLTEWLVWQSDEPLLGNPANILTISYIFGLMSSPLCPLNTFRFPSFCYHLVSASQCQHADLIVSLHTLYLMTFST